MVYCQAKRGEGDEGVSGASLNGTGSWPGWLLAWVGTQNRGGSEPAMKINTQILLAFLLIALIPLGTIGFLSYFNTRNALTDEVLHHLYPTQEGGAQPLSLLHSLEVV